LRRKLLKVRGNILKKRKDTRKASFRVVWGGGGGEGERVVVSEIEERKTQRKVETFIGGRVGGVGYG